jgi:fatty acid desaturase
MGALQRPTDYLTREEIKELRALNPWRSTWLIAHCWLVIFLTWTICAIWTNPLTIVLGIMVVGGRQLGLAVLGHDGAHHVLYKSRKLNDWVTEWFLNRPLLGASIVPYRNYHLDHHKHTQQENDPDLHLSAPFPITRASFRRKVIRDLTGQTGWKQKGGAIRAAFGKPGDPWPERLERGFRRLGPNMAINAVFLGVLAAAGHWYLYILLWIVPSMTWQQLISRIRNIGEHAAVPDDDDRLKNTRTTLAGPIERIVLAPYWVNYHLEHHLLVSCPCYKLPRLHRLLIERGHGPDMELRSGYIEMLKHATSELEAVPA